MTTSMDATCDAPTPRSRPRRAPGAARPDPRPRRRRAPRRRVAWGERREEANVRAARRGRRRAPRRAGRRSTATRSTACAGCSPPPTQVTRREFQREHGRRRGRAPLPRRARDLFAPLIAAGDIRGAGARDAPRRRAQRARATPGSSCRPRAGREHDRADHLHRADRGRTSDALGLDLLSEPGGAPRPSSARCAPGCPRRPPRSRLVQEATGTARLPDDARHPDPAGGDAVGVAFAAFQHGRARRPACSRRATRRRGHRPLRRRPGRPRLRSARADATVDLPRRRAPATPLAREHRAVRPRGDRLRASWAATGSSATRRPTAQTPENQTLLNWLPLVAGIAARADRLLGRLALAPHGAPRGRAGGADDREPAREPDRPGPLERRARALRLRRLARPARAAAHDHRLPRPALAPLPRPARRRRAASSSTSPSAARSAWTR